MKRLIERWMHRGKEWDDYSRSWVRRGWIEERQAMMDAEYRRWQSGDRSGGTCIACGLPTDDHPMPERMWRSSPELCAAAIAASR